MFYNIIMKVFVDITFGALVFYFFGFALMYGKDLAGLIGTTGFMIGGDLTHINLSISHETYWLFQCAFVIAVISIVSAVIHALGGFSALAAAMVVGEEKNR